MLWILTVVALAGDAPSPEWAGGVPLVVLESPSGPEEAAAEVAIPTWGEEAWAAEVVVSDDAAWLTKATVLQEGLSTWTFTDGFAFPISLDGRPVGFAWTGTGTWEVRFPWPADGLSLANDLVLLLDRPADEVAGVARGEPWRVGIDQAIVLTADPEVLARTEGWTPVKAERRVLVEDDVDETVIVAGLPPLERARREARRMLDERGRQSRAVGHDLRATARREALLADALPTRPALHVQARTDLPLRRLLGHREVATGSWLAYARDDAGFTDVRLREAVWVQGSLRQDERDELSEEDFDPDAVASPDDPDWPRPAWRVVSRAPFAGGLPPVRLDPVRGAAIVETSEVGTGATLKIEAEAGLVVEAVGGDFAAIPLLVPRDPGDPWLDQPGLPDRFVLDRVRLADGTPLRWLALDESHRRAARPGREGWYEVVVLLPEALREGEQVELEVAWVDEVRFAHTSSMGDLGVGTGLLRVLPVLSDRPLAAFPAEIVATSPPETPWRIAVSGTTLEAREEGRGRVHVRTSSTRAGVAVGGWPSHESDPASIGFPAVRAQVFAGQPGLAEDLPIRVRQVLNFYRGVLPPMPFREIDVVELPAAGSDPDMPWGAGVVGLRRMVSTSVEAQPEQEFVGLARGLAQQWWPPREEHPRDAALGDAMSRGLAMAFLEAGWGERPYRTWRRDWDACVRDALREDRVRLSPVEAWSTPAGPTAARCVGPMILGHMLRQQVGDRAWLQAVGDVLEERQPATPEGLQAALEARTGLDLGPYFDFWVRGGQVPGVEVRWAAEEEGQLWRVTVEAESDVPFGTFYLPVELRRGSDAQTLWITIVDGEGRASELSSIGQPRRLRVDPGRDVLLRERRAREVDRSTLAGATGTVAGP